MIIRTIMKSLTTVLAITLFNLLPLTVVHAQETPKSATSEKNAARAGAGKRTDVYHVHFTKAAVGKAVQLNDWLKTQPRQLTGRVAGLAGENNSPRKQLLNPVLKMLSTIGVAILTP
jgi:hypothetical protein